MAERCHGCPRSCSSTINPYTIEGCPNIRARDDFFELDYEADGTSFEAGEDQRLKSSVAAAEQPVTNLLTK